MALAYWNIVLKGKFRFLEVWTKFLKVILLKISKIQKMHKIDSFQGKPQTIHS